jgi:hypothetical protein
VGDGQATGQSEDGHRGIEFPTVDRVMGRTRLLQPKTYLAFLNGGTWLFVCVSLLRI